ncbi:hypothetical protein BDW02DRAFT_491758 [Decorospora gaudefroyi]|uniref:Cora-domain-containing protein n=1 Tax=Decorospora gaudefroyi TaxID=184978 RepID=A0A6A5KSD9_9PLEO|nr:hypothetical protein BDW02DRAFT_491758 [Decorospora gaudefroyi]
MTSRFQYVSGQPRKDRIVRGRRIDWHYWPDTNSQQHFAEQALDLDETSRPDVEDDSLIPWGLAQASETKGGGTSIDVLCGEGSRFDWQHDINDDELERIMQPPLENGKDRSIRMCFINTLNATKGWLPGNFDIRAQTIRILLKAGLSKVIMANMYSKQCYWAKMGNQRFLHYDADNNLTKLEISYQYRVGWDTVVSFNQFVRTRTQSTYFCVNFPACAMARLENIVKRKPGLLYRDLLIDSLVADDSLKQWQFEIGSRRDLLQTNEKQYDDQAIDFKQATIQLHRTARHWLTLGQDSQDFYAQLGFLRESYVVYKKAVGTLTAPWGFSSVDMCESFDMLLSQCDTLIRWTNIYHDRTSLRINLLFHLANQRESRTNTQIATSTAEVARQTQRDSASMITMATVTMVFLPGTFISTVLSTTFFDYGDDGLHVSARWWVLLATTVPLTVLVVGVWLAWRYARLRRLQAEAKAPVTVGGL